MRNVVPHRGICALLLAASLCAAPVSGRCEDDLAAALPRIPPTEPADALATFETLQGFRMELIAAEPLVVDPVAMVYDENGRAFVAEMRDYPYTDKSTDVPFQERTTDEPIGRVRLLLDTDGDGRFDESHIFAEELSWPTGLACWRGGIFVAATPHIWYLKDTDGDHRADVRRQVFTGFRKFNVQAVMNNLVWGLDHRIYGAASGNGGQITRPDESGDEPVIVTRRDFRFHPETLALEAVSGGARFGNTFDDWGNRFICNIRNPVQHVVLPNRYLARNPYLPVAAVLHDAALSGDQLPVFRISPPEPWRNVRAQRWAESSDRQYPRSETAATGFFTSSSGITIYRGAAYPRKFYGNAFLGEVAANAIHRQRLAPDGVTFRAQRADEGREFLASTDNWFRPVNFVNAPDGTLHVLDMYRETIEHPWSIPDDIKEHLDLESGRDRGRIYRLAYGDGEPPSPPQLRRASAGELVGYLEHPSAWWRETAHRLIYERQDASAAPALRELLMSSPHPLARLHALWSLKGIGRLHEHDLVAALADPEPGVREHAVRLAESRLGASAELRKLVGSRAHDPDIRVRWQTAFTLGEFADSASVALLAKIARGDVNDAWMQTAVLSSAGAHAVDLLKQLLVSEDFAAAESGQQWIERVARIIGARNQQDEPLALLTVLMDSNLPAACDSGVLRGIGQGLRIAQSSVDEVLRGASPALAQTVAGIFDQAQVTALDPSREGGERIAAIELLEHRAFSDASSALGQLIDARQPAEVQLAAVDALASFRDTAAAGLLLGDWGTYAPAARSQILARLLTRVDWTNALLDAIEDGRVAAGQLAAAQRQALVGHRDSDIRARAETLFAADALSPRRDVIAAYSASLDKLGDAARGQVIFDKHCASCHQLRGAGKAVGPALETVKHRTPDELLVHILDPNREVSPNYIEYTIIDAEGRILTGIIVAETPASITLRRADGVEDTVLRTQIDDIGSAGRSLMPEGLEKTVTPLAMADLIALIRGSAR